MIACILHPSCFCEIWALYVSWITYDHLYYAPCFACWVLFGSLVPTMCNCTSCTQVHELQQNHCGDIWEGTLFSWLHVYYAHLAFVRFEHSVCRGSLVFLYLNINLTSLNWCNFQWRIYLRLPVQRCFKCISKIFLYCSLKYLLYEWSLKKKNLFSQVWKCSLHFNCWKCGWRMCYP